MASVPGKRGGLGPRLYRIRDLFFTGIIVSLHITGQICDIGYTHYINAYMYM